MLDSERSVFLTMVLAKRYGVFLVGLFINSLGVAMITKADLGTSPISSIPYVSSLEFAPSLGVFTVVFSLLLILLQILLLRKNFKIADLLQIPVSIAFGAFIDLCMELLWFIDPTAYTTKFLYLILGCLVLGIGVYLEMLANVVMLPGEAFVRAVVTCFHTEFGTTKMCFDVSMTVIAALLSLNFFHALQGVHVGTIVAALLVGFVARQLSKALKFLPGMLFGQQPQEA